MTIEVYSKKNTAIKITHPNKKNGLAIARLVERCPPLDLNSTYHYFIQSHYFSKTSAVAFDNNEVIAFASGFILPENNNSLFIWQVAITAAAIALVNNHSVFLIVVYAWTLLGISFAPLLIILSIGRTITVKTYLIGLLIGLVSFFIINHFGINRFVYAGFIPFCLNLFYVYMLKQKG